MNKGEYLSKLSVVIQNGWNEQAHTSLEVTIPVSFGFTKNEIENFCKKNNVFIYEFGAEIKVRGYRKLKKAWLPKNDVNLRINNIPIISATDVKILEEIKEWEYFDKAKFEREWI